MQACKLAARNRLYDQKTQIGASATALVQEISAVKDCVVEEGGGCQRSAWATWMLKCQKLRFSKLGIMSLKIDFRACHVTLRPEQSERRLAAISECYCVRLGHIHSRCFVLSR